ncbi:MAG: archaeosortase A [Halobacteriaceae archaeon]
MALVALAWAAVGLSTTAAIAHRRRVKAGRWVAVLGWATFAMFWAGLLPVVTVQLHSPIETVGAVLGVGVSLLVGYRIATRPAPVLFQLTTAVAVAGTVYLGAATIDPARSVLVETAAAQTHHVAHVVGFDPVLGVNAATGDRSTLTFLTRGDRYRTVIVFACTGIGAIAAFSGIVAAVEAPLRRRIPTLLVVVTGIWVLNLVRNVFIAVAFGRQWFQVLVPQVMAATGYQDPGLVSYFVADRLIAQPLSVVALVGVTILTARLLPDLLPAFRRLITAFTGDRNEDTAFGGVDG